MMYPPGDILIVDDDTSIVDLVVTTLREAGYSVCVAYDGASALLAMELDSPALVLLDLHMPGVGGQDVLAQRWWYGLTDVPVVMMTSDAQAVQRLSAASISEYILKPFTLDTLLTCVSRYVPLPNQAQPMVCTMSQDRCPQSFD